jgi:hypothetical protein
MSQILSIAARKAAAESGKYISAAGAFLLVLAISIGVLPNLSPTVTEQTVSQPEVTAVAPAEEPAAAEPAGPAAEPEPAVASPVTVEGSVALSSSTISTNLAEGTKSAAVPGSEIDYRAVMVSSVQPLLGARTLSLLASSELSGLEESSDGQAVIVNSAGLKAVVSYNLETERGIQSVWFEFKVGDALFYGVPRTWIAEKQIDSEGRTVLWLGATDLVLGNVDGKLGNIVIESSAVGRGKVHLKIVFDNTQAPVTSSLTIRSSY